MVELGPDDFLFLNEFPLAMRWADYKTRVLWVGAVDAIRPVVLQKARAFWDWSLQLLEEAKGGAGYEPLQEMLTHLTPKKSVRFWLSSLPVPSRDVHLSWDPDTAAVSDWGYFRDHWDGYCQEGDDVLIWDAGEAWVILFERHGNFLFARRRAARLAPAPIAS